MSYVHAVHGRDLRGLVSAAGKARVEQHGEVGVAGIATHGSIAPTLFGANLGVWVLLMRYMEWFSIAAVATSVMKCAVAVVVSLLAELEGVRGGGGGAGVFDSGFLAGFSKFLGTVSLLVWSVADVYMLTLAFALALGSRWYMRTSQTAVDKEPKFYIQYTLISAAAFTQWLLCGALATLDTVEAAALGDVLSFGFALVVAAMSLPVIEATYYAKLGPSGFGMAVVLMVAVSRFSPVLAVLVLRCSSHAASLYDGGSVQASTVFTANGGAGASTRMVDIGSRLRLAVNPEYEKFLTPASIEGCLGAEGGAPGPDSLRILALVGDRLLGSALALRAHRSGWSVGKESQVHQLILSNATFSKVFDATMLEIFPGSGVRSEKRKGTVIEALVGAAYLSGSVTLQGLDMFLETVVAPRVGIELI